MYFSGDAINSVTLKVTQCVQASEALPSEAYATSVQLHGFIAHNLKQYVLK